MKRLKSASGYTATIVEAYPRFDPCMRLFWLRIFDATGRLYYDQVFFKEGKAEKHLETVDSRWTCEG